MSLDGNAQTFIPYTLNGVSDAGLGTAYVPYTGAISDTDLGGKAIRTTNTPALANDLVNKTYVDTADALKVPYTGATGNVTLGAFNLTSTTAQFTGVTAGAPTNYLGIDGSGNLRSVAPLLGSNNSFTGTNSFTNTVTLAPATAAATFTLGINGSNQIVKFTPSGGIGGSVSAGYVPYASSANTLADSIVNQTSGQISVAGKVACSQVNLTGITIGDAGLQSELTNILNLNLNFRGTTTTSERGIGLRLDGRPAENPFSFFYRPPGTTTDLTRMVISSAGSVGIGTATPAYKLDVSGGATRVNSGDSSYTVYGPNATWNANLIVGATPDVAGPSTAQVIATNGNLHLDGGNSNAIYYGYYANNRSAPNSHQFWGGTYVFNQLPQNNSDFSQVCVMNGNQMLRSQAVAHQVVVYASNSWAGGTNLVNAFYRYNGYTSQMIIGRLSYYVSGSTQAYYTMRIYSQSTGQVWYFQLNNFTNFGLNHITVPIYAVFTSGYSTATGWFDIYVYNAGNCITDPNDILDIHVITLPASQF